MDPPRPSPTSPTTPLLEPIVMCLRLRNVARVAAAVNFVAFGLSAFLTLYEYLNFIDWWKERYPGEVASVLAPVPKSLMVDGAVPLATIFLFLIFPNCLVIVFKRAWAAYLWIEANAVGNLGMIIWLIVVFTDENIEAVLQSQVRSKDPPGYVVPPDHVPPLLPARTLRYFTILHLLLFGGTGAWFTLHMFQYARFLQDKPKSAPTPAPAPIPAPPTATPSAIPVRPVVSDHSEAVHPTGSSPDSNAEEPELFASWLV